MRTGFVVAAVCVAGCGDGDDSKRVAGCSSQPATHALVYSAGAVPGQPVTPSALDATVKRLCERARREGVSVDVKRVGTDRISIGSAARLGPSLRSSIGSSARLEFYDWEPNLLPRGEERPAPTRAVAERIARAQRPRAEAADVPPGGPSPAVRKRLRGDRRAIERLYDRQNDTSVSAHAPRGVVILADDPGTHAGATRGYWVLEDDAELSSVDITNPKQTFDAQTNEPIVSFGFTPRGRRAFARATRREAERGARVTVSAGTDPTAAFQHFAITLDHKLLSLPTIDYRALPRGISGSTGAQISDGGNIAETRSLARNLSTPPLPLDLVLLSDR
jgi:SecD/SecF fusion protein